MEAYMFKEKIAEILRFFEPVQHRDFIDLSYINDQGSVGNWLWTNTMGELVPPSSKFEMALIFADIYLNPDGHLTNQSPQRIREELYKLRKLSHGFRVADLGNLKTGKSIHEANFILDEVCTQLFALKVNVVVVGGTQLLTLGMFNGFKTFENNINLLHLDARIDLSVSDEHMAEGHYLNKLMGEGASNIYNIACLGYQTYFVDAQQIKRLNENYFEHYRLGDVRANPETFEPVIRDADLVSFDISAVRMSEAPAQRHGSPNGFFADEACRLARYAGISDRVQAFGLYEIDALCDRDQATVKLAAQIIWHYLEGYINRKHDFPHASLEDCTKYVVQIDEIDFPIVFYKSNKSGRWWLEIKTPQNQENKQESVIVSCHEDDYRNACKNEIPDRWWLNFKKLK
jgi:formiminoglutamase